MTKITPIFATENNAAKLLDMKLAEFRKLVRAGYLPGGREIAPGFIRWDVDTLKRIASGDAVDGMADIKW